MTPETIARLVDALAMPASFDRNYAIAELANIALPELLAERKADKAEIERLRFALREIAVGDGIYGAQAREYKKIARGALEWKE